MTPLRRPPCPSPSPARLAAVAATLFGMAAGTVTAQAPPPGGAPPKIDQQVQNESPRFLVRASVDKKYRIYAEGDELTLKVRCEEDAHLYVLYQQADGKVFQIFPNSGQPDNRVKAMQDVQVPSLDDAFRWVVGPPLGVEVVKVIASKKPLDALSLPGLREDHFNPVTSQQVAGAGRQLGQEPPNVWSEHDLEIKTVKRGEPTEPPEARKRVGVFFGVSDYEFNAAAVQAQRDRMMERDGKVDEDKIHKLSLGKCHRDATDMARAMKQAGRLADARVFLNGEVTRDKMREQITEWLPSVTGPGDTAFIFFSGHGDQILDDGHDEKDGMDETLDTTEMMTPLILNELMKRKKQGRLPPELRQRVDRLWTETLEVYRRTLAEAGGENAPGAEDKANGQANAFLIRSTVVTDDEMGHWVQKLDGRRVVVILDSCHSGGLNPTGGPADPTRARGARGRPGGFDFLRSEFARLKDLDQPSLTVLSAASEDEASAELGGQANGAFTAALLSLVAQKPAPIDVRQALDFSRTSIAEEIEARNRLRALRKLEPIKAFVPQLFTTDPQPVYLTLPPAPTDVDPAHEED